MFFALNMELEIIRTVLKNEINEIFVCTDVSRDRGSFYTMISVQNAEYRKMLAEKLNSGGLFFGNKDFVGSFIYSNKLNLVFCYHNENLLSALKGVYLYSFSECKKAASNLVAAFAESGIESSVSALLLNERNINITREGNIYFNYFLDFAEYNTDVSQEEFVGRVSGRAFEILEINYKDRYSSDDLYPNDLRLYSLKMKHQSFTTFGEIIITIRGMSDSPIEMRGVVWWIKARISRTRNFLFRNSLTSFLTILVLVTVIYAGFEIGKRIRAAQAFENNVSYNGIENIGNVYLGSEE